MHSQVGIRELRNQVAAVVRRAGSGERVIVTVDGKPVAQLGPIEPVGTPTLDDLVAAGLLQPPISPPAPTLDAPIEVAVDAGAERVIAEVRGE